MLIAVGIDTMSSSSTTVAPNRPSSVPGSVIRALAMFTTAMVIAPLFSFYFCVNYVFDGNSQWAGLVAAIVANVVVLGYVVFAWKEDSNTFKANEGEESKKSK
ncbi:vacuolar ATPase assembly integral membrane protein VMA21 [Myxozyma melibiosi]|uniref:Vacuolar ATPase assembly integral membrane protein VMA21 n=1 Tax=Myxozyma melibiosi TaxID=54550 RepID=A0ABR1EXT4_9ASCO